MSKRKLPKKWIDVYPQGTKVGDEEQAFFISIARNPKWTWRSVSAIAQDAKLSKERTEELIEKYFKKGMIFQNPSNEDMWGYWERNMDQLPSVDESVASTDHKDRIKNASFDITYSSWEEILDKD